MAGSKWGQASGRHGRGLSLLASRPSPWVPLVLLLSLTFNWLLASDRLKLGTREPHAVPVDVELPTPVGLGARPDEDQVRGGGHTRGRPGESHSGGLRACARDDPLGTTLQAQGALPSSSHTPALFLLGLCPPLQTLCAAP